MTLRHTKVFLAAVGTSLLVYYVVFLAIVDWICRHMGGAGFRAIEVPRYIEAWGVPVPLWCVALLWLFLPIVGFALQITFYFERIYRGRHGMCLDCGHRLVSWRGRCPGCGVRVGPG